MKKKKEKAFHNYSLSIHPFLARPGGTLHNNRIFFLSKKWKTYRYNNRMFDHVFHRLRTEIKEVFGSRDDVEFADLAKLQYMGQVSKATIFCNLGNVIVRVKY